MPDAGGSGGHRAVGSQALSIAVEGVIGVGKTTLARALRDVLGAVPLFEEELANPFLERFYKQRQRWALACQLFFLEARVRQFRQVPAGMPVISDHSLAKDPLFAAINLPDDELAMYERYYQAMVPRDLWQPQVTIWLTAPLDEVRGRIRRRGRKAEDHIDLGYLGELVEAYGTWLELAEQQRQRVVVVSADGVDIAGDRGALERLVSACAEAPQGISYCNPIG